jgi:hypothetical protein
MARSTRNSFSAARAWFVFVVFIVVPPVSVGTTYRYNDENLLTCRSGSGSYAAGRRIRPGRGRSLPVSGHPPKLSTLSSARAGGPTPPGRRLRRRPWSHGAPRPPACRLRPTPATSTAWAVSVQGRPPPIPGVGPWDVFAGRSTHAVACCGTRLRSCPTSTLPQLACWLLYVLGQLIGGSHEC